MKRRLEHLSSVVAVTAAIAAGSAATAKAEQMPDPAPGQARAAKIAKKITCGLYDRKDYPKGVPVPGLLNGSVEIDVDAGNGAYPIDYENPIVLVESHPRAKTAKNAKLLDGSWIGIPSSGADGHVDITPVQIKLGHHDHERVSLHLADAHHTVLDHAGVYTVPVENQPDQLWGFDIQDGDSGKFPITAQGMK